jgi:hypothetical protein
MEVTGFVGYGVHKIVRIIAQKTMKKEIFTGIVILLSLQVFFLRQLPKRKRSMEDISPGRHARGRDASCQRLSVTNTKLGFVGLVRLIGFNWNLD